MLRSSVLVCSITMALLAVPVAVAGSQQGPQSPAAGSQATFLDYPYAVPSNWFARVRSSSMRLAEYATPTVDGGMAEVVVYFFGKGQGGSVEDNLTRWKSQFTNPAGGAVPETVTHPVSKFPTTIAEYRGTYMRAVGMETDPGLGRPNHILIAVVAETPNGTLFFQMFGPVAAVESQRAAYLKFAQGLLASPR